MFSGNRQKQNIPPKNGFLRNLAMVSCSNLLQLAANIALGLFLPILLNVEQFGYYKIYTLYVGYCGLLHFGFIDGILLKYGGQDYEALDRTVLRTHTKLFFLCQLICSLLIMGFSAILLQGVYRKIAILIGSNLMLLTIPQYYQYLSQATSRFREFSFRKVLTSAATLVVIAIFFWVKAYASSAISFYSVILAMQSISLVLLIWYTWTYRDITFGKGVPAGAVASDMLQICKKGFWLTIAYETAQLLLLLDRQFVSLLFSVETYAQYAFAYNLLSCLTTLIVAASTVMFPMLKKTSRRKAMEMLSPSVSIITVLVCFSLAGYYLVVFLVNCLLPQYAESLKYFRIVFPAMTLSSSITIVMFTFCKVLDRIFDYFKNSLIACGICFLLNIAAYFVWKTPEAISCASVLSVIIWYILISRNLSAVCHDAGWKKNFLYALSMMTVFYLSSGLPWSTAAQCIFYLAVVCVTTCIAFHSTLKAMCRANAAAE